MTDGLDAGVLAQLAEAVRPALRPLRDADTQNLNELTIRRNQLMTMLVTEKNRPRRGTGAVHPRIKAHISRLDTELKDLDQGLGKPLLRNQKAALRFRWCGPTATGPGFPPPAPEGVTSLGENDGT